MFQLISITRNSARHVIVNFLFCRNQFRFSILYCLHSQHPCNAVKAKQLQGIERTVILKFSPLVPGISIYCYIY